MLVVVLNTLFVAPWRSLGGLLGGGCSERVHSFLGCLFLADLVVHSELLVVLLTHVQTVTLQLGRQSAVTRTATYSIGNLEIRAGLRRNWHNQIARRDTCISCIARIHGVSILTCAPIRRLASSHLVVLGNVTPTLVDEDSNTSLADGLLIRERHISEACRSLRHTANVVIALCVHHGLTKDLVAILEDLLLNDVLLKHLIVELERLLVDQLVIETFAVSWLNDVTLGVDAVLVAFLCWALVLALKLLFLLHSVIVMLYEATRWR